MSKSRLAPIKSPSLPQLELTAVNIAARLSKFIVESFESELTIKNLTLWTDSEITVHWLSHTNLMKKPYVRQRVENIKNLCPNARIRHVPGNLNPADLLTRGITSKEFSQTEMWHPGPAWLLGELPDRPPNCANCHPIKEVVTAICSTAECKVPVIIDVKRYNSYQKALRVTGYVLKFIAKVKRRINKVNDTECCKGRRICKEDICNAEKCLVKLCQKESFPDVCSFLGGSSTKKPALVSQLKLVLIEGIIHSYGRLKNAAMSDSCKYPILLPHANSLTRLIIANAHKVSLHSGVNHVLNFLREKWWIVRGRQSVKSVIRKCVQCLKVQGKPFPPQTDPPLPAERVNQSKPFQVSGVDYTGALLVKDHNVTSKAYIVLFTCAVTRAIHLEVVYSLSEEDFLRAFIKFSSRRSMPQIMYSDNAANFIRFGRYSQTDGGERFNF